MIGKGYRVEEDLYDISRRIKQIDESYFIFRRYRPARYEVHSTEQRGGSLCVVVPTSTLDERTLTLVRRTRRERHAQLLAEMEEKNRALEREKNRQIIKKAEVQLEYALAAAESER